MKILPKNILKTRLKNLIILSLTIVFSFTFQVSAQEKSAAKADLKIAVLDVEDVIKNSLVVKDIQDKVSKKQQEFQKEIDKRQAKLEVEGKKLESKKAVMSAEAFAKESEAFEKKIDELKKFVDTKRDVLKNSSTAAMEVVNDKIKVIIADISKEKNLDLIVPASQTLFYKNEIDVSSELLKRLNKSLSSVAVNFEQKS